MNPKTLRFQKWHGIGNDFVIIEKADLFDDLSKADITTIADRRYGIGADQVILLENSKEADVFMRIYNADGSEAGACGNASRCVGRLMMDRTCDTSVRIETISGILTATDSPHGVAVDMGPATTTAEAIGINPSNVAHDTHAIKIADYQKSSGFGVSMGNPHIVFFVENIAKAEVKLNGPIIETDSLFQHGINVGFAELMTPDWIKLRVWERGAGETLACGTGACAAAFAANSLGLANAQVRISMPGGDLWLERTAEDHMMLSGAATFCFRGVFELGAAQAALPAATSIEERAA